MATIQVTANDTLTLDETGYNYTLFGDATFGVSYFGYTLGFSLKLLTTQSESVTPTDSFSVDLETTQNDSLPLNESTDTDISTTASDTTTLNETPTTEIAFSTDDTVSVGDDVTPSHGCVD